MSNSVFQYMKIIGPSISTTPRDFFTLGDNKSIFNFLKIEKSFKIFLFEMTYTDNNSKFLDITVPLLVDNVTNTREYNINLPNNTIISLIFKDDTNITFKIVQGSPITGVTGYFVYLGSFKLHHEPI